MTLPRFKKGFRPWLARGLPGFLLWFAICNSRAQNALDSFNPSANGNIRVMAPLADGSVIIGGDFTTINGATRNHIAKILSDGSLDGTFNPGANDWVLAIALQSDSNIVVAGAFTTLGGGGTGTSTRNHIGRLGSDGSLDGTFNPGANDWIWSLGLTTTNSAQKILAGGLFSKIGGGGVGFTNRTRLACLNLDGTVDPSFSLGVDSQINTFFTQPDGRVLLGGFFTAVGGTNRPHLARLNSDGSLDATYNPAPNAVVWKLAGEAMNTVLAVGDFTTAGGTNRNRIVRLDTNGVADATFNPGANSLVDGLTVQLDNRIVVGGNFTMLGGTNCANLGRLNLDGTFDASLNLAPNNSITCLANDFLGRTLAGGSFTAMGGQTRNHLARFGFQSNDNFTNATLVAGDNVTGAGSNLGGTRENGEPLHAGRASSNSVWWRWTAPDNRTMRVDLNAPGSIIAVYNGTNLATLAPVASSAANRFPYENTFVEFSATAGVSYAIAVDSQSPPGGDFLLRLISFPPVSPPVNDNFAAALPISGMSNSVSGGNTGATFETNEPLPYNGFITLGGSIWWSWIAPSNSVVSIDSTGSSMDAALAVYTGTSVSNLNSLINNDDQTGITSGATFSASAGAQYMIAAYGVDEAQGQIVINLRATPLTPTPPPPGNDKFANAVVISGTSNVLTGTTLGAASEPGEQKPAFVASGHTVWYSFIAPANGTLKLQQQGNPPPVLISVYQGTVVSNLNEVANNYQGSVAGSLSQYFSGAINVGVGAGQKYYISVDGAFGGGGNFTLGVFFNAAPSNDYFVNRIMLSANASSAAGSNVGASVENNEQLFNSSTNTVWWSWTPTQSQTIVLTTFGSTFDTFLSVYTNTAVASLSLVASNDNAFVFTPFADTSSRIRLSAVANRAYQLQVGGAEDGQAGGIALNFVTVALDDILALERIVQPDRTVNFNVALALKNYRATVTGPLRIRLVATPDYSVSQYLSHDADFLSMLNVPDEEIGLLDLSSFPLAAGANSRAIASGQCPAPVEEGKWGFGWQIKGILEELVGGNWVAQDGRILLFGEWPIVGTTQGPAGGVTTITSTVGGNNPNPAILQVTLGPPAAVRLGGAWRVSPTNYGEAKELRFYTNYTASKPPLVVQSTHFSIEVTNLPGFTSPANQALTIIGARTNYLDLEYSVLPPRLLYNRSQGLGMTGTLGTTYRLESATQFTAQSTWTPVNSNFTLGSGTNWIPGTTPPTNRSLFFRSVWLTN